MDFKSVTLLNTIRASASDTYKARIPEATAANISQIGDAILNYTAERNEFVNALVNKVAMTIVKNKLFENPLKEFKKGTLEYGKDIEEIFVDLIKAETFDAVKAETEVFKTNLPDIKAVFHRMNRHDVYSVTVRLVDLKKAFNSADGFNSVIDKIVQALYTSDNFDEFLHMKNIIKQYGVEGKFNIVTIDKPVDEATTKDALKAIKKVSNDITFLKNSYNYAGVYTHTEKPDQIVLIDTDFDASVDVDVLASAFNMDKADFIGRRVLVDDFGGLANVVCAIVDRDWFMVYDNDIRTEEIYNPKGLYYNYFLHHIGTLSASPFANAILFVTTDPVLDSISVYPATATMAKGESLQLNVESAGTGNPSAKVIYTCDGDDSYVSTLGLVYIGKNETKATVTITATSVVDGTKTDTCVITVA